MDDANELRFGICSEIFKDRFKNYQYLFYLESLSKRMSANGGRGDFCGYGYPSVFSNIQMVASIVQPIFSGPAATELLGLVNRVIVISEIFAVQGANNQLIWLLQ